MFRILYIPYILYIPNIPEIVVLQKISIGLGCYAFRLFIQSKELLLAFSKSHGASINREVKH
jgi:hypothetical protein